jgi:hypothetical protein
VGTNINILNGVAAISGSDVWAVGYYYNGSVNLTLTEHWNGTSWSIVYSPNVGTYNTYLFGVAAVSSGDVWAVGFYFNGSVYKTLVERWNGTSWNIVSTPNVGTNTSRLNGVAAISGSDVWAVGYYHSGSVDQTLAEHWNGTSWSVISSPDTGSNDQLFGVGAISSSDVWAVGFYYNGSSDQTLVEHWNGTSWSRVLTPNVGTGDNVLRGVAAISGSDVWAVGYYVSPLYKTLVEQWDGSVWSIVGSPDVGKGDNQLTGVGAISSSDVWAVGYYYNGSSDQTLVEQWRGTQWSVVPSPNVGTSTNLLNGVAAVSASDVWAVGSYAVVNRTLVERYNPCVPSPTPTPTATATSCSIQYTDVPSGSTFYPYVRCLACRGIINGYPDSTFKPNNPVTRGQLSKIVSNSAGFSDPQTTQMFQDVPVGSTFQIYIGRLASRGYINGYPCGGGGEPCVPPANLPYFRPNANATRGQISKIDANAAGFNDLPTGQQFEDVLVGSTYYTYIYRLVSRGVLAGYPCGGTGEPCIPPANLPYFRPNNNATRGQTSKIVSNTFFPNCLTPNSLKR